MVNIKLMYHKGDQVEEVSRYIEDPFWLGNNEDTSNSLQ